MTTCERWLSIDANLVRSIDLPDESFMLAVCVQVRRIGRIECAVGHNHGVARGDKRIGRRESKNVDCAEEVTFPSLLPQTNQTQ